MTRDEVIALAKRVAVRTHWFGTFPDGTSRFDGADFSPDALLLFASLVAAAEREACAKVCEDIGNEKVERLGTDDAKACAWDYLQCAAAIRARGEKP